MVKIFAALAFFAVLVNTVVLFFELSGKSSGFKKHRREILSVDLIFIGVMLVFSVLSVFGLFEFYGTRWLYPVCFVFGAISFFAPFAVRKIKLALNEKGRNGNAVAKNIAFVFKAAMILIILELFVFNFNSFLITDNSYVNKNLSVDTSSLVGFTAKDGKYISDQNVNCKIVFTAPDTKIATITVRAKITGNDKAEFRFNFADESNASTMFRTGLVKAEVINNFEKSQTIPCSFSGKVSKLVMEVSTEVGENVYFYGVDVNNPIMLHFSFVRYFSLLFALWCVYSLYTSKILSRSYSQSRTAVRVISVLITLVFMLTAVFLAFSFNAQDITDKNRDGNQITRELVDAFEHGQVSLLTTPPQELESLDNPYDLSEREEKNVKVLWDHLYFNGKYYSYYGIAPVILFYLPYHLITGNYCSTSLSVLFFGLAAILFLTKFVLLYCEKFFKNIRAGFVLMFLLIVQFSSGVWFCFASSFYEIAQLCGMMFLVSGLYFLLSSGIIDDKKEFKWLDLCLSSTFLSLAVMSRPTLALYCIGAVIMILFGVYIKKRLNYDSQKEKQKNILKLLLSAFIPFVVLGSIQMLYNYARFGSFFDFGIDYSLTINDFTKAQFHVNLMTIGFFNYLFVAPFLDTSFPFVHTDPNVNTLGVNGYYFVATKNALGLIFKALPMISYLFGAKAFKFTKGKKHRAIHTLLFLVFFVVCPCIIIASIWESGYGTRYVTDFGWQMITGALTLSFMLYESAKSKQLKKVLTMLLITSLVVSFVCNFAQVYEYMMPNAFNADVALKCYRIERLFEFWI